MTDTPTSETEEVSETLPEADANTPKRDVPAGNGAAWVAVGIAGAALIVGALALAAQLQPALLEQVGLRLAGTAPPAYDPAPQEAALAVLSTRIDAMEGRLTEAAQSVQALTLKQASISAMADRTDALVAEMNAVAGRLDAARQRIDSLAAGVRDADVRERVDTLSGDITRIEGTLSAAAHDLQTAEDRLAKTLGDLASRLDELTARTRLLEVAQPEHVATAASLALAAGQVRAPAVDGRPFDAPLASMRALLAREGGVPPGVTRTLQTLEDHAAQGVDTLDALRRRLATEAGNILRAGIVDADGWMDQTLRRLASIVTVRRIGEQAGESTEARLARAETRLAAGDLAAAVAEISALSGASAEAAIGWLDAARARLAVAAALADLEAFAVSRVATIRDAAGAAGSAQ